MDDEQNGEKPSDDQSDKTANQNKNNTTTTETCEPVQNETAAVTTELSEKTENTAVINETKTSDNAAVADASKNGNGVDEKRNALDQEPLKGGDSNASAEASSEKISLLASAATTESSATTNGEVADQIHQNGDHGESDQAVIEKSKAQIEVNSNTDNNVSAATLDSLSSTSISPSNVQIHVQDLKASSEVPDEIVQINNVDNEPVIENSTDTEIDIHTVDQSVDNEVVVSAVAVAANIAQATTEVFGDATLSKTATNTSSLLENVGVISVPPPLPISPPPSQVSVFAFTNNEDTIQTKNFEPAIDNLIEENKTEIPFTPSETDNSQEIVSSIHIESEKIYEKSIFKEPDLQLREDEVLVNVEIERRENKVIEKEDEEKQYEANLCKDLQTDESAYPSIIPQESQNDEEQASVAFAATVINEITETAAAIVKQHLQCGKEPAADELSPQDYKNVVYHDDVVVNGENVIENNTQSDQVQKDGDGQKSEELLPLVIGKTTNYKAIECSSDFTESNLIHQIDEEMNSLNKSNNFDEIIHLDPTKVNKLLTCC